MARRERWTAGATIVGVLGFTVMLHTLSPASADSEAAHPRNTLEALGGEAFGMASSTDGPEAGARAGVRLSLLGTRATDADLARLAAEGTFDGVRELYLGRTAITDAGLAALAAAPELEKLTLGDTAITDSGVRRLRPVPRLHELHLHGTRVTDHAAAELASWNGLCVLGLGNTALTDAGLASLAETRGLEELSVEETRITPAGVRRFQEARQARGFQPLRVLRLPRRFEASAIEGLRRRMPDTRILVG